MISIIVPIYNSAIYLSECIESILAQTERDWQLILVDDGSSDDSVTIARAYATRDARIEFYEQQHAGQSAARNTGLSHVQGTYIVFVDADDALEPDWCTRHLNAIEGVDYVQSGYKRIQQKTIIHQKTPRHRYQFTSPCMRLYRRETIEGMRFTEGIIYEDVLWSVNLWLRNATCRIIHYTGYLYTLNPHSTTSKTHPDAQREVLGILSANLKNASFRNKWIIGYTLVRLKLYFSFLNNQA